MTTEEFEQIVKDWLAHGAASRDSDGPTPSWSTSRCSSCSPTCGPTASRRSSSPAAASSSCGRGPSRSTASRPSRSSAAASRRSSRCATASPCSCGCRRSNFVDDKAGKPVGIHQAHRPAADRGVRQLRRRLRDAPVDDARHGRPLRADRPPHRRRARVGLRPRVAVGRSTRRSTSAAEARLDRRRT